MNNNTINHSALVHLAEAGAITRAIANGTGDIWVLIIRAGEQDKTVMAKNSGKARVWRKLDTLAKYLKDIGLEKFEIDVSDYDPSQKSLRRPDSASTLKRTHKAHKSYQKQFPDVLEDGISENTTDKEIEVAKERWEARRAKILQQENPRAK